VKSKYSVDNSGKKDGPFMEFHPNGKTKIKASYKDDKLDGEFTEYSETGLRTLAVVFKDGELVSPRSKQEIFQKLLVIDPLGRKIDSDAADREAGLARLKGYRYLCEVPYENLVLDDEMNKLALAGAKLLEKIGRLDHKPANPGLPEADYKLGYSATSRGNLAIRPNLAQAVIVWMDDSEPGRNYDTVGHRRWCLNPFMQKTGLGRSGNFCVMTVFDSSAKTVPDFDFITFPARGPMPSEFFNASYPWSVQLHPKKYQTMDANVQAKIWEVDQDLRKVAPLKMIYNRPNHEIIGLPNCLIFQAEKIVLTPGKRYLVEIDGVKRIDGKTPAPIRYVVEFFRLNAMLKK
jgi:hypothetical protein